MELEGDTTDTTVEEVDRAFDRFSHRIIRRRTDIRTILPQGIELLAKRYPFVLPVDLHATPSSEHQLADIQVVVSGRGCSDFVPRFAKERKRLLDREASILRKDEDGEGLSVLAGIIFVGAYRKTVVGVVPHAGDGGEDGDVGVETGGGGCHRESPRERAG